MQQISPDQLRTWMAEGKEFGLIDVREAFEHEHFSIGGDLIPLGDLMRSKEQIQRDVPVVLYCEKGIRSVIAIQRLEAAGLGNLINLEGGMKAWRSSMGIS